MRKEELQKENEKLKFLLYKIRNITKDKIICQENGFWKPCKNLTKQEVYESFVNINTLLKGNYIFLENEKAIREILEDIKW